MFPHGNEPHASQARVGGGAVSRSCGAAGGRRPLDVRRAGPRRQRAGAAPQRPRHRARRPRGGHDVEPPRVRGDGPCRQQGGGCTRDAQLVVEVPRGHHGARPHRAPLRRGRRGWCRPAGRAPGPGRRPGPRRSRGGGRHRPHLQCAAAVGRAVVERRCRLRLQFRHDGPPQGGAAHTRVARPRHRALGRCAGADRERPLPGGDATVAHPRALEPARRGGGRRTA